jgi:hypothetical protein
LAGHLSKRSARTKTNRSLTTGYTAAAACLPLFEIALVLVYLDHVATSIRNTDHTNRHVIKATKEISMQHLILLAVLSMMVLYVLTIVGCLCYIGRHVRRTF